MNPHLDNAWRHAQEILEQNLVRYSAQAAAYSATRPAEVDFAQIRLAKNNLEEALAHEPR